MQVGLCIYNAHKFYCWLRNDRNGWSDGRPPPTPSNFLLRCCAVEFFFLGDSVLYKVSKYISFFAFCVTGPVHKAKNHLLNLYWTKLSWTANNETRTLHKNLMTAPITKFNIYMSLFSSARGWGWYKSYQLLFIRSISEFLTLVPQVILVTAPELQEDLSGTKVKKVLLAFAYIYNLSLHWCPKRCHGTRIARWMRLV